MSVFSTAIHELALLLTPTFLRRPVMTALMGVLTKPVRTINQAFCANRSGNLYNLNHNGQACRIKQALNQLCGITDYTQGFQLRDNDPEGQWLMVYDRAADRPLNVSDAHNLTLYDTTSIVTPTTAFTVICPRQVTLDQNQLPDDKSIVATVEKYRLVSRTASYSTANN